MPIMNAKEPSPRILNSGFMKMLNNLPKSRGISVFESSSVATKKGKSDGTTDVDHKFSPVFAADKFDDENKTKHIVNNKNIIGKV